MLVSPAGRRVSARPARVTGLQAAQVAFAAELDAWAAQFSAREYAVLLELLAATLERERRRVESQIARWAA